MRFLSSILLSVSLLGSEALADGAKVYQATCQVCHGPYGGKPVLPNARNLKTGVFKNAKGATLEGILDVLQNGLPGTAMTAQAHIPLDDRKAVAAYVMAGRPAVKPPEKEAEAAPPKDEAKVDKPATEVAAPEPNAPAAAKKAPKVLTLEAAIAAELAGATKVDGDLIAGLNPYGLAAGMPAVPEPIVTTDAGPADKSAESK
jgi:hypothetical protein